MRRLAIIPGLLVALFATACHGPTKPPTPANQGGPASPTRAQSPSASALEVESQAARKSEQTAVPSVDQLSPALLDRIPVEGTTNWAKGVKVSSTLGVVTSVEQAATQVGVDVLSSGGNAIDAAVATAFALAVTHPSAGNIGGGGFLLLKRGDHVEAIDFRENAPSSLTQAAFDKMIAQEGTGPVSIGVPGTVAGLYLAHQRYGKLPWRDVVHPSVRLAENGYRLGLRQAHTIRWAAQRLRTSAVAREVFFETGRLRPKRQGSNIKRPRLALALSRIEQRGAAGFYSGPTAEDVVRASEGKISLKDLSDYRAKIREPLFFDFHDVRVITMPPPSAGGVALAQMLLMLDALGVDKTRKETAERYHLIAEASRRAQVERQLFVVAPENLSKKEQDEARRRALDATTWLQDHPVAPTNATASSSLHPDYEKVRAESDQTTHFSVIDAEGNLVSCTVTLSSSYGSAIFTNDTGIALNNSVASFSSVGKNTPRAGQRTTSSMAPTLALRGQDALVLGSPGGDTIPSTLAQVFLRLVLDDVSIEDAVRKPRIFQGFAIDHLITERYAAIAPAELQRLTQWGHSPKAEKSTLGDANIAALVGGKAYAVADPREGGQALPARSSVQDDLRHKVKRSAP